MRSSSHLLSGVLTRLLACVSIGLTVACQSQPSPVNSPSPISTEPSSTLPSPSTPITPPTTQPTTVATPTPISEKPTSKKPSPPDNIVKTPIAPSPKSPQKSVTSKGTSIYQNQQLGIKFEYPAGYTIDDSKEQKVVNVWLTQDYQAVKSGKYENTEPPGHLNISVEANPQKLPPEEWVKGNSEFLDPANFSKKAIAGKPAVGFRSSGLFDFQHLIIPSDDGSSMVVISVAEGDQKYQKVLDKVTSSLELTK
jgi:hypothetical protein